MMEERTSPSKTASRTLAIYRGNTLLHFGVSLPHEGTVARLIDEMAARAGGVDDAPAAEFHPTFSQFQFRLPPPTL